MDAIERKQLQRLNDEAMLKYEHQVRREVAKGENEQIYGPITTILNREAGRIVSFKVAGETVTLIKQ